MKKYKCDLRVEVIRKGGFTYRYEGDLLHNENGPAIESKTGSQEWYINGYRHREDGPAVIDSSGEEFYYLNGQPVDKSALDGLKLKNG